MFFALYLNWGSVLLAAVTAFIVLCVLASLILKELYEGAEPK
jgi:hypothetical protein